MISTISVHQPFPHSSSRAHRFLATSLQQSSPTKLRKIVKIDSLEEIVQADIEAKKLFDTIDQFNPSPFAVPATPPSFQSVEILQTPSPTDSLSTPSSGGSAKSIVSILKSSRSFSPLLFSPLHPFGSSKRLMADSPAAASCVSTDCHSVGSKRVKFMIPDGKNKLQILQCQLVVYRIN